MHYSDECALLLPSTRSQICRHIDISRIRHRRLRPARKVQGAASHGLRCHAIHRLFHALCTNTPPEVASKPKLTRIWIAHMASQRIQLIMTPQSSSAKQPGCVLESLPPDGVLLRADCQFYDRHTSRPPPTRRPMRASYGQRGY